MMALCCCSMVVQMMFVTKDLNLEWVIVQQKLVKNLLVQVLLQDNNDGCVQFQYCTLVI